MMNQTIYRLDLIENNKQEVIIQHRRKLKCVFSCFTELVGPHISFKRPKVTFYCAKDKIS